MNAYELADQVEMWGEDLLALNMKGGIPVVQGAKMLRQQADLIAGLEEENERLYEAMERAFEGLESSLQLNKALLKERSK
jgi:hypothetical protein